MYSSIKKTKARPGDWIVILGAGGGLGHMYDLNYGYHLVLMTDVVDLGASKLQLRKDLRFWPLTSKFDTQIYPFNGFRLSRPNY